nr:MAG TPA: hypothetical protein [Caudoviricetes sp.]
MSYSHNRNASYFILLIRGYANSHFINAYSAVSGYLIPYDNRAV